MAVAAPSRTVRINSQQTRWLWGLVGLLIAGTIVWNVLDTSTLAEQREALVSVDSIDIDRGPRFIRYKTAPITSGQADIIAIYTGQSGYDMSIFADPKRAERDFEIHLDAYDHWPEVQEINTFAESERCFLARDRHFCFGFEGTRAFGSHTMVRSDPDGLEAFMLLRTARKHWYRFFDA